MRDEAQTGPEIDPVIPTRFGDAGLGARCDSDGTLNEAGDFRRFTFWDKTAKKTERLILPLWNVRRLAEDFVSASLRDAKAREATDE